MRSLVVVGSNGSGKSQMIQRLYQSLARDRPFRVSPGNTLFDLVQVSARRDRYSNEAEEPHLTPFNTYNDQTDQLQQQVSTALKRAFAAAMESVQGSDGQYVIPGLKKVIREIIKGYTARDETIERRLASLNEVFQLVFPGMQVEVVHAAKHHLSEDYHRHALAINKTGQELYPIHSLSDGEKEVFFLVWRVLSMPERGYLLVDEPEAHLHRAAVDLLWNRLEREKPLVFFVYFTHDLAFASSRVHSEIVSLNSYTPPKGESEALWDWSLVPQETGLPPEVLLKVVGSRGSQVLFVEGDAFNSLDYRLYHAVYGHEWMIVPRGGGSNVRKAVEAMNGGAGANPLLGYQVLACGIVDRDTHSDDYLARLAHLGLHTLGVNEVENFFCTEEVFTAVALHSGLSAEEAADKWKEVQLNIIKLFEQELEFEIDLYTRGLVAEAKGDKRTVNENKIRGEVDQRLKDLASDEDVQAILRAYNASKEQKKLWIGVTAARALNPLMEQEAYIDAALQVIRERTDPAWSTMEGAVKRYLPQLPAWVGCDDSSQQTARSRWIVDLKSESDEHEGSCQRVFEEEPKITLEQLTVEAQKLIIEWCGLPKSIPWTTRLFDFYAHPEANNAGEPEASPNEKGKEKQQDEQLSAHGSSLLEETKEAFLAALVKVGRSQALADQREKFRSRILDAMQAAKREHDAREQQQSAAAAEEEETHECTESRPPEQGESQPVGEPTKAKVTEANSDDDDDGDPFAAMCMDDQERAESQPIDPVEELKRKVHDLELRNARLIEELKQAKAGPKKRSAAVASLGAPCAPAATKPDHRLYNDDNCGQAIFFLSVDLREANFQALRALGYVDPQLKSWRELVDEVLDPVESVAALFYAKGFRMHCLKGFESSQVKCKMREMMREIRQAIGDLGLGEPVEDDNCDEVIFKIRGEEQARAHKQAVEKALAGLADRISFRVELFRLSIKRHDGYYFFAKTNVETNEVQIKKPTPLASPEQ